MLTAGSALERCLSCAAPPRVLAGAHAVARGRRRAGRPPAHAAQRARGPRADERIALLGAMQSLFEGSMYTFVFLWTPALSPAGERLPHGMIFACFLVASMAGARPAGSAPAPAPAQSLPPLSLPLWPARALAGARRPALPRRTAAASCRSTADAHPHGLCGCSSLCHDSQGSLA